MKKILSISLVLVSVYAGSLLAQSFEPTGKASFYANKFEGKTTASGEKYRHDLLTAAHRTLPLGTMVRVTNLANGKSVVVKINDRGPFVEDRIIDVSKSAAAGLDFVNDGLTDVRIELVIEEEQPLDKSGEDVQPVQQTNESKEFIDSTEQKTEIQEPITISTTSDTQPKAAPVPMVTSTYYQIKTEKTAPKGFGLQIASYQESANLLDRASVVEKELQQKVTIQVVNSNGNRVYRLIVGEFDTRAKAEYFKDSIKNVYPGFVVTF